ncbi:MAG TPA: hypothetical protein VGI47_06450 [Candidatus Binataceae bacterium]
MASSCPKCGANVATGQSVCPTCGDAIVARQPNNVIAALAYLLGLISGVALLYLEPYDRDDYVRFHAHQSIAFSVAWIAFNVITGVFIAVLPHALGGVIGFLQGIGNLALAVLWVFLMYEAYIGERFRVPILADWLDGMGV